MITFAQLSSGQRITLPTPFFGLLALLAFSLFATALRAAAEPPKAHVLVLNSYHQGFRWTDELTDAVLSTLDASGQPIEIHIEYMDTKRRPGDVVQEAVQRVIALKYQADKPDIIITSDDDALDFIASVHGTLFPRVPVVFCGINNVSSAMQTPREHFTGIIETLDIKDNIDLALNIFPDTREIVFLSDGTSTGLGTRQMAWEVEPKYSNVHFTYLNGETLTTEEMLARLKQLTTGSIVLAPTWYMDAQGTVFNNNDIYPLIAAASPVPVFITSSANLGLGVFGGKVNSGATQGFYAAEQAIRILTGQVAPRDIPVETGSRNRYMFDSRQLTRFQVAESDLPPKSIIQHRPFSFYQTYRLLVWTVVAVFCLFIGMIAALLVNVHRLRETRSDLLRSEENLRITLHSIGDAVISTDIDGRVTRMNPVAETLTGWTVAEAVGKPLTNILPLIDALTRQPRPNPVETILTADTVVALERNTLLVAKDGTEYRIADSGAPIRNSSGQAIGIVFVFRDITEEFSREAQRNQSQKLEAIGLLAGGIAHDFNNMLGGILGSAELLSLQLGQDTPHQHLLETIIRACKNASALTRKLLAFSSSKIMTKIPMDIHAALINAQNLLIHSLDKRIAMHRDFRATATVIEGDSSLIENSIINLCVNAAQAMEDKEVPGTLTLTTDNVLLDDAFCLASPFDIAPGNYVRIGVIDTGCGIDPALIDRIFEPFFTTKTGANKGTGLGLSAVYGTVREHGGSLSISSELGVGTSFFIYLPVIGTELGVIESDQQHPQGGKGCILVVDDEEFIRTTAALMLESLGYEVLLATDGLEGLDIYSQHKDRIDLVLLDMIMPRMGGRACFKGIRALDPNARVVISSGYDKEEHIEELRQAGVQGFVRKPYRLAELARIVALSIRHNAP